MYEIFLAMFDSNTSMNISYISAPAETFNRCETNVVFYIHNFKESLLKSVACLTAMVAFR